MCFFHKWEKWSEIKKEYWARQNRYYGYPVGDPIEYIKEYQDRKCLKCGKYQKRYID